MLLSISQALQNAAATTQWAVGMCDNFVANMYGFKNSGYQSAAAQWAQMPANDKHPGDTSPPAGALVFWGGGYGHVAISDGQGGIYSTDAPTPGVVSHVSADFPSRVWGKPYLGWSTPYFQGQSDQTNGSGSPITDVFSLGSVGGELGAGIEGAITGGIGSGFQDAITQGFAGIGASLIKWTVWGSQFLLGMVLIGIGLYLMVKDTGIATGIRRGISATAA